MGAAGAVGAGAPARARQHAAWPPRAALLLLLLLLLPPPLSHAQLLPSAYVCSAADREGCTRELLSCRQRCVSALWQQQRG